MQKAWYWARGVGREFKKEKKKRNIILHAWLTLSETRQVLNCGPSLTCGQEPGCLQTGSQAIRKLRQDARKEHRSGSDLLGLSLPFLITKESDVTAHGR